MSGTRNRLAAGAGWLSLARVLVNALQALTTFVLARVLLPADMGVVALGLTMLNILTSVTDISVTAALIQHRDPSARLVDTAFTLNAVRAGLVAATFCLCVFPASFVYTDPRLPGVMLVLALGVVLGGVQNPRVTLMVRDLVFWQQFVLTVTGKLASTAVSIGIALAFHSYWALVLGSVAGQVATSLLSYSMLRYRPRPGVEGWRELIGFSTWLFLAQLVTTLNWNFDHLLVGWKLGSAALGLYAVGNVVALIPTREALAPLTSVLFPAFSSMSGDPARLRAAYQDVQSFTVAVALPLGVGIAVAAEPLVRLALGAHWMGAVPVVRALAAIFALQAIGSMAQPLAMARGETRLLFVRDVQGFLIRVPAVAAGMLVAGLPGVVAARVMTGLVLIALNLNVVARAIDLSARAQLARNVRSLLSAVAMAPAAIAADRWAPGGTGLPDLVLRLATVLAAGGLTYLAVHALAWQLAGRPAGPEREVRRVATFVRDRLARRGLTRPTVAGAEPVK